METLEKRIIWLAGFTDGEGTITVFTHLDNSDGYNFRRYQAQYSIVNTNPVLINEVQKILNELEVSSHLMTRKRQNENHSDALQLNVRKLTCLVKLLTSLIPYLIGKKAQAELALRFVQSRLARPPVKNGYSPYNDEEKEISKSLYSLNKKGCFKSSETIRQTPKGDDIVRTAGKPAELMLV